MFDTTVHRRDKNGNVVDAQPYRLSIVNGEARYERPVGSGLWYSPDGTLLSKPEEKVAEPVVAKIEAAEAKPAAAAAKGK